MFEDYKRKIGYFLLKRKNKHASQEIALFNQFISTSFDYLIIMPTNEIDYQNGFDIIKYFKIHKKNITLFLPEHKSNDIILKETYNIVSYNFNNINNFGLPTKVLINKLNNTNYDVLIDLERDENLFLAAISSFTKAKFKVGFKKNDIDNLYNFQVVNTKINSEISYRNLLSSLKMF